MQLSLNFEILTATKKLEALDQNISGIFYTRNETSESYLINCQCEAIDSVDDELIVGGLKAPLEVNSWFNHLDNALSVYVKKKIKFNEFLPWRLISFVDFLGSTLKWIFFYVDSIALIKGFLLNL